jgi:hypothetical protein
LFLALQVYHCFLQIFFASNFSLIFSGSSSEAKTILWYSQPKFQGCLCATQIFIHQFYSMQFNKHI